MLTDVVIVGGGPAGAAAGYTLGKLGINNIIVDRKPRAKIGDKVCGDALSPLYYDEANEIIGFPKPKLETGALKEIIDVSILKGKTADSRIILGNGSSTVDRLRYGQDILEEIENFDCVQIIADAKLKAVNIENSKITSITIQHLKDGEINISCKLVIDASGSSGVVRSRLPEFMFEKFPKKIPREEMIVAYREIIKTKQPHDYKRSMHLVYEPELKMPGYYWVFSRGDRELNIGLGWMITEENRGSDIREINRVIRERRFPDAEILVSGGDQIPARLPLPSCVHNGFMAVGDAAALANPLNGEGHGPALLSGIKAAQIASEAVKNNAVMESDLWEYNKWVWGEYGVEFSFGISIVKFVNKFGFNTFNWLMEKNILQEDDILLMLHEQSPDLQITKRALRGWYKPHILLALRKVMNHIEEIQEHAKNYPNIENFEKWNKRLKELEKKSI